MAAGNLKGILVAIIVSLVARWRIRRPIHRSGVRSGSGDYRHRAQSAEQPDDETFPGLLMLRVEGRVFFVNAERIGAKLRALMDEATPRAVALDLSGVSDLEYTAQDAGGSGERGCENAESRCG